MQKRIVNLTVIILGMILIVNLARDIWRLLKAGDRVSLAQEQVAQSQQEKRELEKKMAYYQSEEFIEEQARDKLNLSKEGETVVILPENLQALIGRQTSVDSDKIPNWRQWLNLFF